MMDYRPGGKQFLEAQKRFHTLREASLNENIPIEVREEMVSKIKKQQDKLSPIKQWRSPKKSPVIKIKSRKRTVKTK